MSHNRRRASVATSEASSSCATSNALIVRKYDHLIQEQRTLVSNAQEGLKQSLTILEKASTNDERESATLQVNSLVIRCQELIMKLKVVLSIRCEMNRVRSELINAIRENKNASGLYSRQQWLEGRMDGLLLKRRGRPGARGQRQLSSSYQEHLPSFADTRGRSAAPERPSTIGSISGRDGDLSGSFASTIMESRRTITERDSDEWSSSESETKWTTVKTATPGDNMEYNTSLRHHSVMRSSRDSSPSPFDRPRSLSLFEPHSWNLLSLIPFTDPITNEQYKTIDIPEALLKNPLQESHLLDLWREIVKLQDMITSTFKGIKPLTAKTTTTTITKQKSLMKKEELCLPDIVHSSTTDASNKLCSRKVYGKTEDLVTYPRASWHCNISCDGTSSLVKQQITKMQSRKSIDFKHKKEQQGKIDMSDDLSSYKDRCIKELLDVALNSHVPEKQKDAIETLSGLPISDEDQELVDITLKNILMREADPSVRYEALKTLIKRGAWSDELLKIVTPLISEGSEWVVVELLSLMVDDIDGLMEAHKGKMPLDELLKVINKLMHGGANDDVRLLSAVVFANCNGLNEDCESSLRQFLYSTKEKHQNLALTALIVNLANVDSYILDNCWIQTRTHRNWKYRIDAVEHLKSLVEQLKAQYSEQILIDFIIKRLSQEPIQTVKVALSQLACYLRIKDKCVQEIYKKVESQDVMKRAEGVLSLSGFATTDGKIQQVLMDIIELDTSTYIRLLGVSVLSKASNMNNVIRNRLLSRCEGTGPVSRQCRDAFKSLLN